MNQNLLTFLVQESGLSTTYERERIEQLVQNVAKYCIGAFTHAADAHQAESALREQFNLQSRDK
jgi:hypothetical protein